MTNETVQEIRALLASSAGRAMYEYLSEKLEELRNIESLPEKDVATHQLIEVKSQKRAYTKLKEIMSFLTTMNQEKKEKDERDSYNVE